MGWIFSRPATTPEDTDVKHDEDFSSARDAKRDEEPLVGIHKQAAAVDISQYEYNFENIALEGGGNKGLAYCGALRVLEKLGISVESGKIKRLAGTSSGGMTAALLAIGYNSHDIEGFLSQDIEDIFLDSRFGYLSLVPNLLSIYGWNPGNKIFDWFGEKVEAKLGNPDFTFQQLYEERGIELCVVVTNLNQMSVEYCHPKTTPDMAIRIAVRMSMSIPVMFAPMCYVNYGNKDMYVDGGVLCNFPVHAYDGWWLSMAKEDGFFTKITGVHGLNCLMQNSVRFGKYNPQTVGLMLYADDEEDLFRSKLQSRVGTKLYIDDIPDTKLGRKYKELAEAERVEHVKYGKFIKAVNSLMQAMSRYDTNGDQRISFGEFKKIIHDTNFSEEEKVLVFGENYDINRTFIQISKNDNSIIFKDLLDYLAKKGLDVQSHLLGYKRRDIDSLSSYINSIQSTLSTNVGRIFMQATDVKRTVGINTGHVGTRDFDLETEDRNFLVERGRISAESFLKYFVVWNDLKPKAAVPVSAQ